MSKKKNWYPSEEELRNAQLKLWKRWMIHTDPNCFNGWLVVEQSGTIAGGW